MTLMAAPRDASCYNRPDVRSVKQLHIAVVTDDRYPDYLYARCNGMILDESLRVVASSVPERRRCHRPGCRARWPAEAAR